MGVIKDLIDLVTQLTNSVHDRKFAAELREIQRMIADLQSEQASMHEERIRLMTENAELKHKIVSLQEELSKKKEQKSIAPNRLAEESEKMLILIASANGNITQDNVVASSGLPKAKADYFFDHLKKRKFIDISSGEIGVGWFYVATPAGREYLVENDLI